MEESYTDRTEDSGEQYGFNSNLHSIVSDARFGEYIITVPKQKDVEPMSIVYSKGDLINPNTGEVVGKIRPTIYISGPMFSQGHLIENIRMASLTAKVAYNRGWAPVTPHYDILGQLVTGELSADMYLDIDLSILATCKALVAVRRDWDAYTKDGVKTGTQREVELAESLGIPVYLTVAELPWK